jgi:hypothetical protein
VSKLLAIKTAFQDQVQYDILQPIGRWLQHATDEHKFADDASLAKESFFGSYAIEKSRLRSPDLSASDELGSEVSFPLKRHTCWPYLQFQC